MSGEMLDMQKAYSWTDNKLAAGLVGAVGATFFATMFGEWFYALGWVPFSFNTLNGEVWATNYHNLSGFFAITKGTALSPDFTYFLGMWAHYSQGIIFGLVFTLLVYPNLPGSMSTGGNLLKGILWGWTLWIVSSSFVMPLLYGTGFWFSYWGSAFQLGQANLIFYNFVWHSIYGFVLGMFFSPAGRMMSGGTSSLLGSLAHWVQVLVGWIIIIGGGWISSLGFTTNAQGSGLTNAWLGAGQGTSSYGVIVGLIGLIVATAPAYSKLMKR